jgi:hypothetical protein
MLQRCMPALVFVMGFVTEPAHAQTRLEWKFNKDDAFRIQTVSTFKQTIKLLDKEGNPEGKEIKQDMEYTTVLGFKVKDKKPDGTVVLEEKIESIKFPSESGALKADEKVQGATFEISLNAKHEVVSLEGYNELLKKLAGEDASVLKTLQLVITKESLMKSAREAFGLFPEKPAKQWTREYDSSLGPLGTLSIKSTYTDEGTDSFEGKPVERIVFQSTVAYKAPSDVEASSSPFRVVKGELKPDQAKGTLLFDTAAGRLVSMTQSLKLKGKLSLAITGTKIDSEIEQEQMIKTTLLKNP